MGRSSNRKLQITLGLLFMFFSCFYFFFDLDMAVDERSLGLPAELDFLLVACGGSGSDQTIDRQLVQTEVMLKSAALFTKTVLHFHIVAEEDTYSRILNRTNTWPDHFQRRLLFSHHPIWYPKQKKYSYLKEMFRECATERLFAADHILPNIEKIVYVDTDVIFFQPPEDLFSYFQSFNKKQFGGMAPCLFHYGTDANKVPYYGATGLNSGVLLMHLKRMREWSMIWFDTVMEITENYKNDMVLGDQDVLNVLFNLYPEKLYELPCSWNFRSEVCSEGVSKCAAPYGISLLHGNSLSFVDGYEMKVQTIFEAFSAFSLEKNYPQELFEVIQESVKEVDRKDMKSNCKSVPGIDNILLSQLKKTIQQN